MLKKGVFSTSVSVLSIWSSFETKTSFVSIHLNNSLCSVSSSMSKHRFSSGICIPIIETGSSQNILQPLTSDSLSTCTLSGKLGTLDHWASFIMWTSSRGGHCGCMCLPDLNRTAESGRDVCKNESKQCNSYFIVNLTLNSV